MAAVTAEQPSAVVFNGIANQYDARPLTARVGERVRFWVLAAGPNRPSSFHVVGGQFDTLYFEGAYQVRRGVSPGAVSYTHLDVYKRQTATRPRRRRPMTRPDSRAWPLRDYPVLLWLALAGMVALVHRYLCLLYTSRCV